VSRDARRAGGRVAAVGPHANAGYAALFAKDSERVSGTTVYKGREAILKMLLIRGGRPVEDPAPCRLSGHAHV